MMLAAWYERLERNIARHERDRGRGLCWDASRSQGLGFMFRNEVGTIFAYYVSDEPFSVR